MTRTLCVLATLFGVACASVPEPDSCAQATADEAIHSARMFLKDGREVMQGYVIDTGQLCMWTLPTEEETPPPVGAVLRYRVTDALYVVEPVE